MRVIALACCLTLLVAGTAVALHSPTERVGMRLTPCHAVLETGASLPYTLEVTNEGALDRPARITVEESLDRFPPLLDAEVDIAGKRSAVFPLVLTAPAFPGDFQLTAVANISHDFGATHAAVSVIEANGTSSPRAFGACTRTSFQSFAPGEAAFLQLEATLTGFDGEVTFEVRDEDNATVSAGSVALSDNITYGFDVPAGPAPSTRANETYHVLLTAPVEGLTLSFNVRVAWDGTLVRTDSAGGLGLVEVPTLAVGFLAGGVAVLGFSRLFSRRFAPAWFLSGLYSRFARGEILAQPTRAKLYETVSAHPGITVQDLADEAGSYVGAIAYHLRVLERAGYVTTRRETAGRRVFVAGARLPEASPLTKSQERILEALRTESLGARELAQRLGITRQGAHFHLKILERRGYVSAALGPHGALVYSPRSLMQTEPPAAVRF